MSPVPGAAGEGFVNAYDSVITIEFARSVPVRRREL